MPNDEIELLKNQFVKELNPLKIYLFGSFAYGNPNKDSDFDFYIIVNKGSKNLVLDTAKAYKSTRGIKTRPVDIILNTEDRFDEKILLPTLEKEVYEKGKLIYESEK